MIKLIFFEDTPPIPHIYLPFKNFFLAFLIIFCLALAILKSFLETFFEIVLPAAIKLLSSIFKGAIKEQLDPTKTLLPIIVLFLFTPS